MRGSLRRAWSTPWFASLLILVAFLAVWQFLTSAGPGTSGAIDPEYARLAGQSAAAEQTGAIPTPIAVAQRGYELLTNAFDRSNPNNLGIAWHLAYSMGRVLLGFVLALIVVRAPDTRPEPGSSARSRIGGVVDIVLPRPRDRVELAGSPEYARYRRTLLEFLYRKQAGDTDLPQNRIPKSATPPAR
jgi:hypothetical protein